MSRYEEIKNMREEYLSIKKEREEKQKKENELLKLKNEEKNRVFLELEEKLNKIQRACNKFKNEETLSPEEEGLLGDYIVLNGDLKYLTDEELFKDIEDKKYGFGMYPVRETLKSTMGDSDIFTNLIRAYYDKDDRDRYLAYSQLGKLSLTTLEKSKVDKLIHDNKDPKINLVSEDLSNNKKDESVINTIELKYENGKPTIKRNGKEIKIDSKNLNPNSIIKELFKELM